MTRDELIRRINEALDSPDGLEGDLMLQRLFVRDAEASDLADQLAGIDRALRDWPEPARGEEAWEALATRIEQRLDENLAPMDDPTAPPRLSEPGDEGDDIFAEQAEPEPEGPESRPRSASGEFSLELLTAARRPKTSEAPADDGDRVSFSELATGPRAPGSAPPAKFIQVEAPAERARRSGARPALWLGGAAAAVALVGLGVVLGSSSLRPADEASMAAATADPTWAASPEVSEVSREAAEELVPASRLSADRPEPNEAAVAESAEPAAAEDRERLASVESSARQAASGVQPRSARAAPAEVREEAPPRSRVGSAGASGGGQNARGAQSAQDAQGGEDAEGDEQAGVGGDAARAAAPEAPAETEPRAEESGLPEIPDRDAVVAALAAVQPLVEACAEGQHGVATVDITVGSSGRVRSALVTGFFAGRPEGSCVARAVRRARFPRFSRESFEVTYPFSL